MGKDLDRGRTGANRDRGRAGADLDARRVGVGLARMRVAADRGRKRAGKDFNAGRVGAASGRGLVGTSLERGRVEADRGRERAGDDQDEIEEGKFWKLVSSSTQSIAERLPDVSALSPALLHGDIVQHVSQNNRPHATGYSMAEMAELVAQILVVYWESKRLSQRMRADYDGLVALVSELIVEMVDDNVGVT